MWTRDYNNKDFTLMVRWRVGEDRGSAEPTEWVEFSASPDSVQTEHRLHLFDF